MQTFLVCPEWQHSLAANPPPLPGASASASSGSCAALVEQRRQQHSNTTLPQRHATKRPVDLWEAHPGGSPILPTMESAGINILSTDDDEVNQEVIRGIFMQEGFALEIAMDGRQCLDVLEKAEMNLIPMPSVLLLDSMMPGMSGIEVCRKLRERYGLIDLSIIMLTCRSSPEEISAAIMAGCNDYVTKPFNRVELLARVRMQLAMQRSCGMVLMQKESSSPPIAADLPARVSALTLPPDLASSQVASSPPPAVPALPSPSLSLPVQRFHIADESVRSDALDEVLRSRIKKLKEEVLTMKKSLRTSDIEKMKLRVEVAGYKEDADHSFETLMSTEEKLMEELARRENLSDRLVLAGLSSDDV